jgi:hypothetical protein
MSQPDLIAALREARPAAPAELRERVRLIAVEATVPPRRLITWRRAAVVFVPVAAAIVAAVVLVPGGGKQAAPPTQVEHGSVKAPANVGKGLTAGGGSVLSGSTSEAAPKAIPTAGNLGAQRYAVAPAVPAPSATRLQRYSATLDLQLLTPTAVSAATKSAVAIAASLGGYEQTVVVRAAAKTGYANIVLRIPRANVRVAVRRLSALGRVTAENVSIQDLTVQVNGTDQTIARLQRQLTALRTESQTTQVVRQIAALTAQVESLQRARATTIRAAHYATVELQLTTPAPTAPAHHKPGPLHGLGVAFHWVWIGAVYALALGAPLAAIVAAIWLLARTVRRRREDRLLAH